MPDEPTFEFCSACANNLLRLLDQRMKLLLNQSSAEDRTYFEGICFHLLELQRLMTGDKVFYPQQVKIKS